MFKVLGTMLQQARLTARLLICEKEKRKKKQKYKAPHPARYSCNNCVFCAIPLLRFGTVGTSVRVLSPNNSEKNPRSTSFVKVYNVGAFAQLREVFSSKIFLSPSLEENEFVGLLKRRFGGVFSRRDNCDNRNQGKHTDDNAHD